MAAVHVKLIIIFLIIIFLIVSAPLSHSQQAPRSDDGMLTLPSAAGPARDRTAAWRQLVQQLLAEGRYREALTPLGQAIRMDLTDAALYAARGVVWKKLGQYSLAVDDFERALQFTDDQAPLYFQRGMTHYKMELYGAAERDFDLALLVQPQFAPAYFSRGVLLARSGRYAEAADDFSHSAALIPDGDAEISEEEANPLGLLTGKTIALYSLRETVLHRIANVLNDTVKDVSVTTFHDKTGGSSALRSAARNADVFVIAIAAAKHAATNFIEGERGSHAVTLKPDGQGSASMLRSLHEYARSITGNASYDS